MANDISNFLQTTVAPMALNVLRENARMAALVNIDYMGEARNLNETIQINRPASMGTADTMNPATGSTSTDIENVAVSLTLDQWKYKQFQLTDKDIKEAVSGLIPSTLSAAVKSIANDIDLALLNLYQDIPYSTGTAGTTPTTKASMLANRTSLQTNLAPQDERFGVVDVAAEAKLLELFDEVNTSGSTEALVQANMGRKYAIDWYSDQLVPDHTPGVLGGTPLTNGVVAAAATEMVVDGGAGADTVLKGDLIQVADAVGPQQYVCTEDVTLSGGAGTVKFYPPTGGMADNKAITITAASTENLVFQRDAFTIAMRALADMQFQPKSADVASVRDPLTGVPMRLTTWWDAPKSTQLWRVDVLYGVATLRPELAVRYLG